MVVIRSDIWKILNDTGDRSRTDGLEPVLGDLYSLMVASSFGILLSRYICWKTPYFSWWDSTSGGEISDPSSSFGL